MPAQVDEGRDSVEVVDSLRVEPNELSVPMGITGDDRTWRARANQGTGVLKEDKTPNSIGEIPKGMEVTGVRLGTKDYDRIAVDKEGISEKIRWQ